LNPTGSPNINGISFQRIDSTVAAQGTFNTLTLTTPITVSSGDILVGFATRNPANFYPMAADQTAPLRQRSYLGTDGVNFALVDSLGADLASNFGIRATVELP
jgi:hypothetical protein